MSALLKDQNNNIEVESEQNNSPAPLSPILVNLCQNNIFATIPNHQLAWVGKSL